jgi:hypothetical protein
MSNKKPKPEKREIFLSLDGITKREAVNRMKSRKPSGGIVRYQPLVGDRKYYSGEYTIHKAELNLLPDSQTHFNSVSIKGTDEQISRARSYLEEQIGLRFKS